MSINDTENEVKIDDLVSGNDSIGVVGLGYVGLPLAVLLSTKFKVVGLDIDSHRIEELNKGFDKTNEIEPQNLKECGVQFVSDEAAIKNCSVVIVTVPTPIDEYNIPNLNAIKSATETVARNLKKGAVIVYESTVYPGVTEEICVPIIEKISGKVWKKDFSVGYSPERVNPGDKKHTIDKIVKVVSGDTTATRDFLCDIYGSVVTAGIHRAETIKVAEAAKVIENTQRDVNIALMNELSIIFNKMNINTNDVLAAAGTKWNFLNFFPGLVGGHCIGVDPFYLTFKAEALGYHPEVILSGRRINDKMGSYVAEQTIKNIIKSGKRVQGGRVLIAGFTFKENIPDVRNTKVIDIYSELIDYGLNVDVYDPCADGEIVKKEYGIDLVSDTNIKGPYLAVILAVKHNIFVEEFTLSKCLELQEGTPVISDLRGMLNIKEDDNIAYFNL